MKRLSGEDRAGLYITVIVHLTVIIVLLLSQIGTAVSRENSFVLDFSKQESVEKLRKELEMKQSVAERIDQMLASSAGEPIRNVAVDRGALKDDRGTDAEKLYADAEKLRQDLVDGQKTPDPDDVADISAPKKEEKPAEKKESTYKGPSVVSYQLDGRKASHLSIPAYRCMGGGEVTVIITVDPSGKVINAKVQEDVSSADQCLKDFAIRAARLSRFSSKPDAPARQMGNIVYSFIAQ